MSKNMSFIKGLEKHGKGKYVTISRDFVWTKTPVQIGSYAQKFKKKTSTIHIALDF